MRTLGGLIACLLSVFSVCGAALAAEPQIGVLYGDRHVYAITAPAGWQLDNRAGVSSGLHAVFYPVGGSWSQSPAVMYANTGPPLAANESIDEYIDTALDEFRRSVGPGLRVEVRPPLRTRDGKLAHLRQLSGDQWRNFETVAYIAERHVTVILVLTSKAEAVYHVAQSPFDQLVHSYEFLGESLRAVTDADHLIRLAKAAARTPAGQQFDDAVAARFAAQHASTVKSCIDAQTDPDVSAFDLLFFVAESGEAERVVVSPQNRTSVCISEQIVGTEFPAPPEGATWVHLPMSITP